MDVGVVRPFVGIGDPCEVLQLAAQRPLVEPFRIALDQNVERAVHEYLAERHTVTQRGSGRRVRRDGRYEYKVCAGP